MLTPRQFSREEMIRYYAPHRLKKKKKNTKNYVTKTCIKPKLMKKKISNVQINYKMNKETIKNKEPIEMHI